MRGKYRIRREKHISRTMTFVICLAAGPAAASTVIPLSLRDLSAEASRVAVGRVERLTSYHDTSAGFIRSRVELAETRSLSGEPLGVFTFEMAGGVVGDVRQWIAGFPNLQPGDQVVLFLAENTATPLGPTVGLWQGVFFIERSAAGAETVVDHLRRPITEVRGDQIVRASLAPEGRIVPSAAPRLSLDDFLGRVRAFRQSARGPAGR